LPISAVDTINLAFQHTKRQLFQPFRFWQWTRLAIVGLLAGEAGGGGSFNYSKSLNSPQSGSPSFPHIDPALLVGLLVVIVVTAIIFGIVMMYVSSVIRFILFDSVIAKQCHIRQGWQRRQDGGWKLFLWHLGFFVVVLFASVLLLGVPALFAFVMGWFREPRQHLLALILGGILLFLVLFAFLVAAAVVQVLTKDFVVPQMALEKIGAVEGWRRLLPMLKAEKGGYAAYIGLKIVLAIGAGIVIALVGLVLSLFLILPFVGVAVAAVLGGKAAGLTWNVFTITAAVVAVCILLAVLFYLTALVSVPVIIFFPAYSIYFFAARYRPLSLTLYPPPPATPDASAGSLPGLPLAPA